MSPSTRRQPRQVQSKVSSRQPLSATANVEDQRRMFREARKAREKERFEVVRNCRLRSSAAAASNVSAAVSITNSASSSSRVPTSCGASKSKNSKPTQNSLYPSQSFRKVAKLPAKQESAPKARKSLSARRSYFYRKEALSKISKTQKPVPNYPKAEVKLTKTAHLRMLKSDPLLQLSLLSTSSRKKMVLPVPIPFIHSEEGLTASKYELASSNKCNNVESGSEQQATGEKKLAPTITAKQVPKFSSNFASPSRIPVKKTTFSSPMSKSVPLTPKPSPLREKLSQWLEKRNQSLDNFKHLKCFGVLGPVVKRPQTPFRKTILSTSTLKAIPESKETTPNKDLSQDMSESSGSPSAELNTTFTLEDEDKENIPDTSKDEVAVIKVPYTESIRELDQADGVLLELFKVIQMGYPPNQCDLWLRAIRRRFPQCGDEPIYWECLASLEEARGDLSSALSCYECAIQQGAQGSVQKSIDELLQKMTALRIESQIVPSASGRGGTKPCENLDSSNIIRSTAIQFEIQEKCNSVKKDSHQDSEEETVYIATPVRRSLRLASTPNQGTSGVTCVRSLNFLEPRFRSSLVFYGNNALDPED